MKKDFRVFLDDILESCQQIEIYIHGVDKKRFEKNIAKQDAVNRRLEIIGEAVKRLLVALREKYSDVACTYLVLTREVKASSYNSYRPPLLY